MANITIVEDAIKYIEGRGWFIANDIADYMRSIAPYDENAPDGHEHIRDNIKVEYLGRTRWGWRIYPDVDPEHAYFAEYGNHANSGDGFIHPHFPNKALKYQTKQGTVFAKRVRPHSGSRFIEKTYNRFR